MTTNGTETTNSAPIDYGQTGKKKSSDDSPNERLISENRKARSTRFTVLDRPWSAESPLWSAVKSKVSGRVASRLEEAYGQGSKTAKSGWSVADIPEYFDAGPVQPSPLSGRGNCCCTAARSSGLRMRAYEKGMTLVPSKVVFFQGPGQIAPRPLQRQGPARQAGIDQEGRRQTRDGPPGDASPLVA